MMHEDFLLSLLLCLLVLVTRITGEGGQLTVPPSTSTCEPITDVTLCLNIGWHNASYPNLRDHTSQSEANLELNQFQPLVDTQCSNAIVHFLCAVYAPYCFDSAVVLGGMNTGNVVLKPCRENCEYVRAGCEPVLQANNFPWPSHLNCSNFPSINDNDGSIDTLCFDIEVLNVSIPNTLTPTPTSTQSQSNTASIMPSAMLLPPAPMITNGSEDIVVTYGNEVTLSCYISSINSVNITWNTTATIKMLPNPFTEFDGISEYNTTLTLSNVDLDNAGDYSCVADSDYGVDVFTVTVTVYVPLPNVTITPSSVEEYYNETTALTCEVQSLVNVTITWTTTATNTILSQLTTINITSGTYTSELVLPALTLDHIGTYTCTGINIIGNGTASAISTVNVLIPIPDVSVAPSNTTVLPSTTASLLFTCTVTSFAVVNITWSTTAKTSINDTQLSAVVTEREHIYSSVLTISDDGILPGNEGVYTCMAVNEAGMNNDTGLLNVIIEKPSVTVTTQSTMVNYNNKLVLECTVVSFVDTQIMWTTPADAPSPQQDSNDGVSIYTSLLTINQALLEHRGQYICTADNIMGRGTDSIDIDVIVPPPSILPIPSQNVSVGYNVSFECIAIGVGPFTYQWSYDLPLYNCYKPLQCMSGEQTSKLTIVNIPAHFSRNITCTVTDIDNQSTNATTELIVNGLELIYQTDTNLTLMEFQNFTFECKFRFPTDLLEPVITNWSLAGKIIQPTPGRFVLVDDEPEPGLLVSRFTFENISRYVDDSVPQSPYRRVVNCEARIGDRLKNKVKSNGISMDVLFGPFFKPNTQTHPQNPTRINVGMNKEVSCFAIGYPVNDIHFEDVTDVNNVIMLTDLDRNNGQSYYTIDGDRVSRRSLQCVANNSINTIYYEFTLIIQDQPNIVAIETLKQTFLSFFTVRLSWTPPFDNLNTISSYTVSYSESLIVQFSNDTVILSPHNYVELKGLGFNKRYRVILQAENDVGYSNSSDEGEFRSISSSDISLVNVTLPRVLITNTSFYIQWAYPRLLTHPLIVETPPTTFKHVMLTTKSAQQEDSYDIYKNVNQYYDTITGLTPDTKYTIIINIEYEIPAYTGDDIMFEIQTLAPNNYPTKQPTVNEDALQGDTPLLYISWMPLTSDNGAEFLLRYIVRITFTQLPQVRLTKRQIADSSSTIDLPVSKTETSFQYDAEPYTQYMPQVFAELNVSGVVSMLPITAPATVESGESSPATPPRDIAVTEISFTSVSLSWVIPEVPNGFITTYTIYQSDQSGNTLLHSTDSTSYTNTTLTGDTTYTFTITASTSVGEGPSASINVTTQTGVYPIATPGIRKGDGRTLLVSIPNFSTLHGPLSHYFIILATGSVSVDNITSIYRYSDPRWRDLGYYATAVYTANNDNRTIIIGDSTYITYDSELYFNAPLQEDTQYRILIRLYSANDNPIVGYQDSSVTVVIEFPSSFNIAAVIIPIVIIILILVLVIVIVVLVILCLRKTPKHTETFYLDEIKSTVKPLNMDAISPSRNGSTSRGNVELRGTSCLPPNLAVQNSEVFTSVGQPTILLCDVTGTPMPEVLWSKDGQTLQGPDYKILSDGSLYILDTDLKDDGHYVVSAYNDGGTVEESVRVVVIAPLPPEPDPAHPPQTVSEFIERMALLHSSMDEQLEQEYHDVDLEWNITVYNAKLPVNNNKNRYVNIVPYDHSRVVLGIQDYCSGTDYINASYIDSYNEPNAYIATQGPIPATFSDFWRMLWEFDIPTIIMVTNLKEDDKIKCHQYWPSYGASNYGDLQVNLKEVENIVEYSIRTFQVQPISGGVAKEIRQFHFQVWPDHGVPQYATALLGFRKRVRKYHPTNKGPMAVHCSAGVGRTGTFICIDTMMRMIEIEGKIDIFNFVRHMRFRRNYMVQTSTQYEFIHEALLETIMCGDTSLPVKSLHQKIVELNHIDPVSGKSGFLSQFQTLESSTPSDEEFDCSIAQLSDNLAKTRSSKHLPPNDNRVVLSTDKYDSDYICASFIDGYRQRQCFITTQGPMKNTAGDFWRMVWEYNTSAIVMLTGLEENGIEQCVKYWPSDEQEICGAFVINKCQEERILPDYTVRKFSIRHISNSEEIRTVTQFHFTNWTCDVCPKNAASINDMIGEVLRLQRKSGNNPITVHCSDGLGRTGTFCAAYTILERVKAEQVVDVFSTIKSLRIQRPGLLQSLDQYEFIHKIVVEFLTTFDNYNNFK